jgi:hypothetical protein
MAFIIALRRLTFAVLTGAALTVGALSTQIGLGALTPATAQISDDAQVALEQYGGWRPHPRFGEVWVPAAVPPDWRPYQYGHWVYTDEWGWYWVSDDVEADWGWVVYHYGRWAFEPGFGWFWVPGDEWGPAWVDWRYGDEYAGWAPLPPDALIETYQLPAAYWVFVPTRFIAAPRLRTYIVPPYRGEFILRQTRIVNRTVALQGRLGVNPGISPAFIARVNGAPVATYRVQPRVFASTQGVAGAVQIRREDLHNMRGPGPGGPPGLKPGTAGGRPRLGAISVERTNNVVQPNSTVTAPQPLGKSEPGRLGATPPRAAQGTPPVVPTTTPSPATTVPTERREEHRGAGGSGEPAGPGGARGPGGGAPPQQPNIVRPVPPQPAPQLQQQQVRPPSPPQAAPQQHVQPPPPPQRQVQPQPQVQPPQAGRPAGPPPGARPPPPAQRPAPPPKQPPPKPGEKPPEPPK